MRRHRKKSRKRRSESRTRYSRDAFSSGSSEPNWSDRKDPDADERATDVAYLFPSLFGDEGWSEGDSSDIVLGLSTEGFDEAAGYYVYDPFS